MSSGDLVRMPAGPQGSVLLIVWVSVCDVCDLLPYTLFLLGIAPT